MSVNIQNMKVVQVIAPQAIVDNAYFVGSHQGTTPTNIDTLGFNYVAIYVQFGAMDIAAAELSLYESDDTTDGNFTIISSSNYATSPATLPSATSDNTTFVWYVTLGGSRKRYLRVNLKGGDGAAGTYATSFAILSRANQAPNTVTERGVAQQLFV